MVMALLTFLLSFRLVLFGVFLIGFVAVQVKMPETATIPGSIIFNRSIIGSMWFTFCLASGMMLLV